MKKFKAIYWAGSVVTEKYLTAETWEKAVAAFMEQIGERAEERIVSIEICMN